MVLIYFYLNEMLLYANFDLLFVIVFTCFPTCTLHLIQVEIDYLYVQVAPQSQFCIYYLEVHVLFNLCLQFF